MSRLLAALAIVCAVAGCGGESERAENSPASGGSGASGGTGGGMTASGGASAASGSPVDDCSTPLAAGTPCSVIGAHCGGPCSNSWQEVYVCKPDGWDSWVVAGCGPNASEAPQCHNSFSGGELTPCCPAEGLDCSGKPDGYPGFICTPGDPSFCACSCIGGAQSCGC